MPPRCDEGKYTADIAGPNKENGQLLLRKPEDPDGFQARDFKDSVGERVIGASPALGPPANGGGEVT